MSKRCKFSKGPWISRVNNWIHLPRNSWQEHMARILKWCNITNAEVQLIWWCQLLIQEKLWHETICHNHIPHIIEYNFYRCNTVPDNNYHEQNNNDAIKGNLLDNIRSNRTASQGASNVNTAIQPQGREFVLQPFFRRCSVSLDLSEFK